MGQDQKNVRAGFLIHTLELKLWHFEVSPYVCMWKPCVCNVSRPLYVSVRYLENSFWLAEYGPGYSVWFLDIHSSSSWTASRALDQVSSIRHTKGLKVQRFMSYSAYQL